MTSEEGTLSDAVKQLETTGEQSVSSLIKIDKKKILGSGTCGTVFEGTWDGNKVAVKRIQNVTSERDTQEEESLQKLDHPNVVKLFQVQIDENFRYYALEFCQASLNHLFLSEKDARKYRGPMPSDKEVLLQLAAGLSHIHEKGLIHRDLKPENVLIHRDPADGEKVLMKWADFNLSKPVNENGSCSISGSNRGTDNWYAPEILKISDERSEGTRGKKDDKKEKKEKKDKTKDKEKNEEKDGKKEKKEKKDKKADKNKDEGEKSEASVINTEIGVATLRQQRATVKSDVFTEGLVFGYYLLGGRHPYGSNYQIALNVIEDKPVHLKEIKKGHPVIHDIIMEMLKNNPVERILSSEVVSKLTSVE